jgi:hypothetical protein
VGFVVGSVGLVVGSVGFTVGSVGFAIGSVVGSVGAAVGLDAVVRELPPVLGEAGSFNRMVRMAAMAHTMISMQQLTHTKPTSNFRSQEEDLDIKGAPLSNKKHSQ